mgnify:CR=1 FL=1
MYIIITDIFGHTDAISNFAENLGAPYEVIEPYNNEELAFQNETEAYTYFMEHIGIEEYAVSITNKLQTLSQPYVVIAFSAGAGALWSVSDQLDDKNIRLALLFYGSQIRHYADIKPAFPSHLVFPENEDHFSIPSLIARLAFIPQVTLDVCEYKHGFMNSKSANFNSVGYNKYNQRIRNIVSEHTWLNE